MRKIPTLAAISTLIASCGLLACAEDVDSEAIRTSGIYANFEAVAFGDGITEVRAELRVGGKRGTFVQLTGSDKLKSSADGADEKKMSHKSSGDRHHYEADHEVNAEGTEMVISFQRGDEDDSAPDSSAKLPAPFKAELDEDEEEIQRGNDVRIKWSNEASGSMDWELSGDCVKTEQGSTDDDGSFVISADDIEVWESDEGEDCRVSVILERSKNGSVDKAFEEGGKFVAMQRRRVLFRSTPADSELEGPGGASND